MEITPVSAALAPYIGLGALVGAAGGVWVARWPRLALGLLGVSVVAGQVGRLPLPGQGGGLLASDIAAVLFIASILWWLMRSARPPFAPANAILLSLLPFLIWSLWPLFLRRTGFDASYLSIALAYWLRLAAVLLVWPSLMAANSVISPQLLRRIIIAVIAALAAGGFVQLLITPNLQVLAAAGWDPHQGRMVSTWLDPNFLGAAFVLCLPFLISWSLPARSWRMRGLTVAVAFGLLLTESRSSLLAAGGAGLLLSPLLLVQAWRRILPAQVVLLGSSLLLASALIVVPAIVLLQERAAGFLIPDATVTLRLQSLAAVWQLAAVQGWTGVGYNAYQFAALEAGLIGDFSIHSRAGADSSWLTLLVTTGLPGLLLFVLPWWAAAGALMGRWLKYRQATAFGALYGLVALLIHSQVVNSFLYAHLLILLILIVSLALKEGPMPPHFNRVSS